MENEKIQSQPSKFNLNELRLPANYGATFGVKKVLNSVSVGKPNKAQFFRIHASQEMTFLAMILEQKETREIYCVRPDVADQIAELVRAVQLLVGVDRQGNAFLVLVTLPGLDGRRNKWHESLAQACELAKAKWIRISANMSAGAYDVFEAQAELMPPEWQANRNEDHSYTELVDIMLMKCKNFANNAKQLWRRILFNHLITNVEHHLQNLVFLYAGNNQWKLSPTLDLNPFPDKDRESKTWLSEDTGPITSVAQLLDQARRFELTRAEAIKTLQEVIACVEQWKK